MFTNNEFCYIQNFYFSLFENLILPQKRIIQDSMCLLVIGKCCRCTKFEIWSAAHHPHSPRLCQEALKVVDKIYKVRASYSRVMLPRTCFGYLGNIVLELHMLSPAMLCFVTRVMLPVKYVEL